MNDAAGPNAAAFAHCAGEVRSHDPDRFFASLFAPAGKRSYLHALYAFNLEIARVREVVSDPMPGEVRLQWWRDELAGQARGDAEGHPVAAALRETIARFRLPVEALVALIDARSFDLYEDPMPSLGDLEGYCGETASALFRLASLILADGGEAGPADAAGHAGVAYGITMLLRAFPWHAARGQLYLPADVLARHGLSREEALARDEAARLAPVLAEMRALAEDHRRKALAFIAEAPAAVRPAFLPLAVVAPYLARMERRYDPFRDIVEVPQWRRQWALWRLARRLG